MKRKFLAALLALVMVFSMIPVSASAAGNVIVTGDDPITDNDRSVSFHLYTTQLYKLIMLEDNEVKNEYARYEFVIDIAIQNEFGF